MLDLMLNIKPMNAAISRRILDSISKPKVCQLRVTIPVIMLKRSAQLIAGIKNSVDKGSFFIVFPPE
jgi:hypothetical protein